MHLWRIASSGLQAFKAAAYVSRRHFLGLFHPEGQVELGEDVDFSKVTASKLNRYNVSSAI